jgi:uncharacterized protein YggE
VLSAAIQAGANQVQGVQFHSTRQQEHEAAARVAAIRDAKARAVALAGEIGQTIGKAFSIQEGGSWSNPPMMEGRAMAMMAEGAPAPADTVSLGRIQISASVTVSFDLQ